MGFGVLIWHIVDKGAGLRPAARVLTALTEKLLSRRGPAPAKPELAASRPQKVEAADGRAHRQSQLHSGGKSAGRWQTGRASRSQHKASLWPGGVVACGDLTPQVSMANQRVTPLRGSAVCRPTNRHAPASVAYS